LSWNQLFCNQWNDALLIVASSNQINWQETYKWPQLQLCHCERLECCTNPSQGFRSGGMLTCLAEVEFTFIFCDKHYTPDSICLMTT